MNDEDIEKISHSIPTVKPLAPLLPYIPTEPGKVSIVGVEYDPPIQLRLVCVNESSYVLNAYVKGDDNSFTRGHQNRAPSREALDSNWFATQANTFGQFR